MAKKSDKVEAASCQRLGLRCSDYDGYNLSLGINKDWSTRIRHEWLKLFNRINLQNWSLYSDVLVLCLHVKLGHQNIWFFPPMRWLSKHWYVLVLMWILSDPGSLEDAEKRQICQTSGFYSFGSNTSHSRRSFSLYMESLRFILFKNNFTWTSPLPFIVHRRPE